MFHLLSQFTLGCILAHSMGNSVTVNQLLFTYEKYSRWFESPFVANISCRNLVLVVWL